MTSLFASGPTRPGSYVPHAPEDALEGIPAAQRREDLDLPHMAEIEVARHFTALAHANYGIDTGIYPLGSCTMKYNPKVNEALSRLPGLARLHPYTPVERVQGALELMDRLARALREITGMDAISLQPAAGAQGELTGILMIRAYHEARGDAGRDQVIVPDSAHGTNPATAAMAGFQVVTVPSDARGGVDIDALERALSPRVAALMLTNPNTLGIFEDRIAEIAQRVHGVGGLLYYDGANLNAIMGITRPGDMGFDAVHLNLHKTFSTPHGGGGPGAGPVGVKAPLEPFLPTPVLEATADGYRFSWERPRSIGPVRSFFGNFGMLVRAYAYIRALGPEGLREASEQAVLNARYLKHRLADVLDVPYERDAMHEFVLSARSLQRATGVRALDLAKRLLDHGVHPPTVYFPLVVEEALMIEPTETESLQRLDGLAEAIRSVVAEARRDPDAVRRAPERTPVGRLDEVRAVRAPDLGARP